jgi:hypothetical protein
MNTLHGLRFFLTDVPEGRAIPADLEGVCL